MFLLVILLTVILIDALNGLRGPPMYDCQAIKGYGFNKSGVYHVSPIGTCKGFNVYCDMTTENGGWLVFQRREDGTEDFYRGWEDYQFGFGDLTGEHWLGNLAVHLLTSQGHYQLRIDLSDWEGNSWFAKYNFFQLEHALDMYRLRVSGYSGNADVLTNRRRAEAGLMNQKLVKEDPLETRNATINAYSRLGDALHYHNGRAFTTKDKDNDNRPSASCAVKFKGAWWYNNCHHSNLNGLYLEGTHLTNADGVNWRPLTGFNYSMKTTEMKIKRL